MVLCVTRGSITEEGLALAALEPRTLVKGSRTACESASGDSLLGTLIPCFSSTSFKVSISRSPYFLARISPA